MELLEEELSYKFRNPELLQQALTFTTLPTANSSPFNARKQNDLKILGDCVIKLLTSEYAICVSLPNNLVHKIVQIKSVISSKNSQIQIGKNLRLSEKGIIVTNLPRDQIGNHLDTFVKNIFGAIFLDAGGSQKKGFSCCWKVFLKLWKPLVGVYNPVKPLLCCFPAPKFSSQEFLNERFGNFKRVNLSLLEEKISFKFSKNPHLLEQAMTHDSIDSFRTAAENSDPSKPEFVHFQNLEFLGDSVLELVIMEYLYLRSSSADPLGQMLFFNRDTGEKLYSSRFQIQVANKLKLEQFLVKPPQVGLICYDDFVESLIGAIYVHGRQVGLRNCAKVVLELWGLDPLLENGLQVQQPGTSAELVEKEKQLQVQQAAAVQKLQQSEPEATPLHEQLQKLLGYKYVHPNFLNYLPVVTDITTPEFHDKSLNMINISKNLQALGKCCVHLIITEYVVGICHSSSTADLSSEMKQSVTKLISDLCGDKLLAEICTRFQLQRFFKLENPKLPNATTLPSDMLYLVFGTVFVDSGDLEVVKKLFFRFWNNYINGAKPKEGLVNCFPDTSEQQQKFRAAVNAKLTESMWTKINKLLGYTFTRKNLLEQALTDEKSQGFAKQRVDAYPLGNPFGLQILGKCVIDLLIAQQCYLNTQAEPANFQGLQERMGQSLFKSLQSRFAHLQNYYANQARYPFPPKKNPRAPYEAMMAALYVDLGGGTKGLQQVKTTIILGFSQFLLMKKLKIVKPAVGEEENGRTVSVSTDGGTTTGGEECGLGSAATSQSSAVSTPVKSKAVDKLPVTPLKPKANDKPPTTPLKLVENIPTFFLSAPVSADPLLAQLQTELGYKFVNPFLLKIVLERDIPLDQVPRGDLTQASSDDIFEMFKVVGTRALNLLATEFALECVVPQVNMDISEYGKLQVERDRDQLTSVQTLDAISNRLNLEKYVMQTYRPLCYAEYVCPLIGAIFVDSKANYLKIAHFFNKFWKVNGGFAKSELAAKCFPNTAQKQTLLRIHTGTVVGDVQWKKMYSKLGYSFKNRNLLEQALTDESSVPLAHARFNVFPVGNPFALRLLGRCVLELVIGYKTLPTSLTTQKATYLEGLERIENSLFNSFKNNFLGTEKFYAWVKIKKKTPFPPPASPNAPFEAILGAVFVDSGLGNPGLDTVAQVLIHRDVGLNKAQKVVKMPSLAVGILGPAPGSLPVTPVKVPLQQVISPIPKVSPVPVESSTPIPSTSCLAAESLNISFSPKCAANFSISPVKPKKSPDVTLSAPPTPIPDKDSGTVPIPAVSVTPTPEQTKNSATKGSPKKSPKKEKKSYASAVCNGQTSAANFTHKKPDNKLLIAVTNAQSQIKVLRKKQESIDRHRKVSLEREKLLQEAMKDQDERSSASGTRSRCSSRSSVCSSQQQQPQINEGEAQKKKKGRKKNKQQNKKAKDVEQPLKPAVVDQKLAVTTAWCQSQLGGMPTTLSTPDRQVPGCSKQAAGDSSCTFEQEVPVQKSKIIQQQQQRKKAEPVVRSRFTEQENSGQGACAVASSSSGQGLTVPVNKVSGYKKTAGVDDDGYGSGSSEKGKTGQGAAEAENERSDTRSRGVSFLSIIKWTSVIIGVALLLKRYGRGK